MEEQRKHRSEQHNHKYKAHDSYEAQIMRYFSKWMLTGTKTDLDLFVT